jgi:hypothetical protein
VNSLARHGAVRGECPHGIDHDARGNR